MKQLPALPLLPLVACLCLLASTGARADPNPYYVGASQTFTHDTNILRLPEGQEISDSYSTTSVLAGFDQPISRQRLYANGAVSYNRYKNRDDLNNTGYGLNAGWDWATIGNLSGTLSANLNRQLVPNSVTDSTLVLNEKNLATTRQYAATAALGTVTKLTFEAGVTHRELDYTNDLWAGLENRQDSGSLGVKYRPSDLLTLGVGARETRGKYNPSGTPDEYRRHDLDLTALWLPSGASSLEARLSFGRQKFDTGTERDFSGTTGSLQWRWKPTGKLTFFTVLLRDTGSQAGYFYTGDVIIAPTGLTFETRAGDTSRVTTLARLLGEYAATAKIKLTASATNTHRDLVSTLL
ncbi:MAG TPA: hypothetical protein VGQ23_08255, partial [Burkholderiaceae bacterium]|nr:hypothetical protein [Burkholderiaceae bacterium]